MNILMTAYVQVLSIEGIYNDSELEPENSLMLKLQLHPLET